VTVSARLDGNHVLIGVADRGPGIAEGDRGRAVERFVRLEKSRSIPGSGLGLSLAAAVARLHGGELRLEDNAPGLRAILVLPRGEPFVHSVAVPAEAVAETAHGTFPGSVATGANKALS
jgi:signal transduction histidine kinase